MNTLTKPKPDWILNPHWTGALSLAHGTLTRQESVTGGKLPMSQSLARAEPLIAELLRAAGWEGDPERVRLIGADQVHGEKIEIVESDSDLQRAQRLPKQPDSRLAAFEFPETDSLITMQPQTMLVIQTADCLPILFRDSTTGMLGACHCGWKGVYARLGQKTAKQMIRMGACAETIEAWLGPAIRAHNYEVGREMVEKFQAEFPRAEISPNGTHLDLAVAARAQIAEAGLADAQIHDSGECTFGATHLYHSYRRDGPKAGRLLTVIASKSV